MLRCRATMRTPCAIAATAAAVSSAYGFSVVFEGLQVVAYSVGGTIVLKNAAYRSPLAIGFLIGLSFMLTLDMLVVAVLAGANLAAFPLPSAPAPAEGAVVAFSVMLFIVYVSWCGGGLAPQRGLGGCAERCWQAELCLLFPSPVASRPSKLSAYPLRARSLPACPRLAARAHVHDDPVQGRARAAVPAGR